MSPDEFEDVQAEPDALRQARRATELMAIYQQRGTELARLRREAIERAAIETGMTFSAVATALGLSKGRISQIRQSAPPAERALFGVGPLTVAVPLRESPGRDAGVIAAEDSLAAQRLTETLEALQFEVRQFQIPTSGEWDPVDGAIAICGPKSSRITAEAIESDPWLSFAADENERWVEHWASHPSRKRRARGESPGDEHEERGRCSRLLWANAKSRTSHATARATTTWPADPGKQTTGNCCACGHVAVAVWNMSGALPLGGPEMRPRSLESIDRISQRRASNPQGLADLTIWSIRQRPGGRLEVVVRAFEARDQESQLVSGFLARYDIEEPVPLLRRRYFHDSALTVSSISATSTVHSRVVGNPTN